MQERIGHVILDSTWAEAAGAQELPMMDVLMRMAEVEDADELNSAIAEEKSWPVLYHFSHVRENVIDWLPMTGDEAVLELGAGCGAITGALIRKAGCVVAIEPSLAQCRVNAERHQACDHLTIYAGDFKAMEPTLGTFDVIFLSEAFAYAAQYVGGDHPHEAFLTCLKAHLNSGGRLVAAVPNRMGLKYFAGAAEDYSGAFFAGIRGYQDDDAARTFTRAEWEDMICTVGGFRTDFYYPYPDEKFPMAIYSDAFLPKPGELNIIQKNFDHLKIDVFCEETAFDDVIRNHVFPQFANAFIIVMERED